MAIKQFYHDIGLQNVGQLIGARLHNVTDAEMATLAATLGPANKGLVVYNTDQKQQFNWDGAEFDALQIDLAGDIVFKGVVDVSDVAANPVEAQTDDVSGYQYIVSQGGVLPSELTFGGSRTVTVIGDSNGDGSIDVESGDILLFVREDGSRDPDNSVDGQQSGRADKVFVLQRNDEQAETDVKGNVRLATKQEVIDGQNNEEAVTPSTLENKLVNQFYTKQYTETVDIDVEDAGLGAFTKTISHGLNLVNADAFTINAMRGASQISLDVDSIDTDTLRLCSLVSIDSVTITVVGAQTANAAAVIPETRGGD